MGGGRGRVWPPVADDRICRETASADPQRRAIEWGRRDGRSRVPLDAGIDRVNGWVSASINEARVGWL